MKDFEYFAPKTVKEALSLLSRYGKKGKVIAGGQSLITDMQQGLVAPEYLIDITGIPSLDYINLDKKEWLKIGALCTHREIETSPVVREKFRVLADMETNLASVQTRNLGTIAGSLFQGPAGDTAPVLIALDARVKITSLRGGRTIPVEELFTSYRQTVLEYDEILTEIQVPGPLPGTGTAYAKFTKTEGDMAITGIAVSITFVPGQSICQDARIAMCAVAPVPVRANRAEQILAGKEIDDDLLEKTGRAAAYEAKPISDVRGSAEYRRELVRVMVKRVAREALKMAKSARIK